jgi:hypothetical protein
MAVDMFIKIDTVDGEAQDTKHKKEIDVLSWWWGMSNSGSADVGGGAGAGKVNVDDLTFAKAARARPERRSRWLGISRRTKTTSRLFRSILWVTQKGSIRSSLLENSRCRFFVSASAILGRAA